MVSRRVFLRSLGLGGLATGLVASTAQAVVPVSHDRVVFRHSVRGGVVYWESVRTSELEPRDVFCGLPRDDAPWFQVESVPFEQDGYWSVVVVHGTREEVLHPPVPYEARPRFVFGRDRLPV